MYQLLSFHNDASIKERYLKRLQLHFDLDEIEKGHYWENGKGCAVGCTVHSGQHMAYEKELGIPVILARLEDRIFEGLPNASAKHFPVAFLTAVPVGVDLSKVWKEFVVWLLTDAQYGVVTRTKNAAVQEIIREVSACFTQSLTTELTVELWDSLRRRARSAAYAAASAAASASASAYAAAAYAYAAAAAAYAAAAYAAAYAAAAAAYAAAAAAAAAYAAAYAAAAAYERSSHYQIMADKLLQLLRDAA